MLGRVLSGLVRWPPLGVTLGWRRPTLISRINTASIGRQVARIASRWGGWSMNMLVAVGDGEDWRIALFTATRAALHGRPEASEQLTEELREVLRASR
jgi:hypothetical protein